ncbi:MAG: hypothetical protein ACTSVA_06530 [Candidatus Njordarchaeales archaeon]
MRGMSKCEVYSINELRRRINEIVEELKRKQISKRCSYKLTKILRRYGINIHYDYYDTLFDILNKIPNCYIYRDKVYRLVIVK